MIESLIPMLVELQTPTKLHDLFPSVHIERMYDQASVKTASITRLSETGRNINTQSYRASSYDNLLKKLYGYLSLENDWDGYGGVVPNKKIILSGEKLLSKFQQYVFKAPKIMLSGSGEIGFYWENGSEYAEITCDHPDIYSFVYLKDKMTYSEEDRLVEESFSFDMINKIAVISKSL